jgi:type IX secretion system PorP/SprF family membrane protein
LYFCQLINLNTILRYIIFILFAVVSENLIAQQLPTYTQYLNNGFLINPAIAGSDGYTSFNATYRKQWMGLENSPTTYSFSGQTRLLRKSYKIINRNVRKNVVKPSTKGRVGLGGFALNDVNGLVSRTGINLTYAYHIFLYKSQISFGISGQAFQYKIDELKLEFGSENTDPIKANGLDLVTFIPDANVGFYWTSEKYFMGFSANQLFQGVLKIGSSDLGQLKLYRHYYLMGGYKFPINDEFDLEPSVLFKTTEQLIPQTDISLRVLYLNDYWAGVSYRTSGSVSTLFGIRADQLYLGLAYDFALTSIRKHSFGSAEIVMAIKFGSNARRYRWINRY